MSQLQYIVAQELPQFGGRKLSVPAQKVPSDVEAGLYAAAGVDMHNPAPPPPPPPAPTPAVGTVFCRRGDDLSDRVSQLRPGGMLLMERGGAWPEPLVLGIGLDGVMVKAFGEGNDPLVQGQFGLMLNGPLDGVTVDGIAFQALGKKPGNGIHGITAKLTRLTILNCTVAGFTDSVVLHHPSADTAGIGQWHKDILFRGNRLMDMGGTGERDGQGFYLQNIDGLTLAENFISRAGMNRVDAAGNPIYSIFAHGAYIQHGNKRVKVSSNIFDRCESFGVQCRGPSDDSHDPDMTDPGPVVSNNIFNDCAIGWMLTGAKGTAVGNITIPGHFHNGAWQHGQGGGLAYIGAGLVADNLRVGGPAPVGKQWKMPDITHNSDKRSAAETWRWDRAVQPTMQNNKDYPTVRVDISDIVSAARKVYVAPPISPYVDAITKRVKDAIAGVAVPAA